MKYAYENLSYKQFENLSLLICRKLFGISVQGFADGTDGGRDARFHGTAELFPSKSDPWIGKVVIQAKHTNGYNKSYSDSDFYSEDSASCTIAEEIPKIKALRSRNELDHYIIFSNRRLTGNTEEKIRKQIAKECGLDEKSIHLIGIESIESYLGEFTDIPERAELDPVDSPLLISPNELSEVIELMKSKVTFIQGSIEKAPTGRTPFTRKNEINAMTETYAKHQRGLYLKHTYEIKEFLSAPENLDIMNKYNSVAEEFQLKVISKRKDYQTFDEVMEYVYDLLVGRDELLRGNKRLTRVVLFYMYWNCDLGLNDETT